MQKEKSIMKPKLWSKTGTGLNFKSVVMSTGNLTIEHMIQKSMYKDVISHNMIRAH